MIRTPTTYPPSTMTSHDPIEIRLFRRGVSDDEVRQAMELVREFISSSATFSRDEADWWHEFGVFFDDLTRTFSPAQLAAFEIGTDTLLVHAGMTSWTIERSRRSGSAFAGYKAESFAHPHRPAVS